MRNSDNFRGIFTIPSTPFLLNGEIDVEGFKCIVDFCIECGAHGLVYPVNASEFTSLSDEERMTLSQVLVEQNAGRLPAIIGVAAMVAARLFTGLEVSFVRTFTFTGIWFVASGVLALLKPEHLSRRWNLLAGSIILLDLIVASLVALSYAFYKRELQFLSSLLMSVAALFNFSAVLLLIYYFLYKRDGKYLFSFLISSLGVLRNLRPNAMLS